jgi:hypothetical protein
MTAPRQQRKSPILPRAFLGLALGCGIFAPWALWAATDDQLVVNPDTGLAISGFDPVAYFTDGKAIFGRPEIELNLNGVVWRFSNEGNRGAFAGHPEVYAPRFGGYDPVAIGHDRSVPGHPLFWVVVGQRLYLFYSEKSRLAFLADPGRIIDTAERKWSEVARSLGN